MATKYVSREEAEHKKQQAVDLMQRIGESGRAREFDAMDVSEYAEGRGLVLTNPRRRNRCVMPQTKSDLQEILDNIEEILDSAYTPESTREDLAAAVGDALDALSGEDEDGNGNGDDEDSD